MFIFLTPTKALDLIAACQDEALFAEVDAADRPKGQTNIPARFTMTPDSQQFACLLRSQPSNSDPRAIYWENGPDTGKICHQRSWPELHLGGILAPNSTKLSRPLDKEC